MHMRFFDAALARHVCAVLTLCVAVGLPACVDERLSPRGADASLPDASMDAAKSLEPDAWTPPSLDASSDAGAPETQLDANVPLDAGRDAATVAVDAAVAEDAGPVACHASEESCSTAADCCGELTCSASSHCTCLNNLCNGGCCASAPYCTSRPGVARRCSTSPGGAGDSCAEDGDCASSYLCTGGRCVRPCVPACSGHECGADGCGGSCGECTLPDRCLAGACCTPSCGTRECGSDGCGGSCGSCTYPDRCSSGYCCTPNCSGRDCGGDGCGGSCGTCGYAEICSGSGTCEPDPASCDPVNNTGCALSEGCWLLSSEIARCSITGYGERGDSCISTSDCAGGFGCFAGTCRKICELYTDLGCLIGEICNGVVGWTHYGACATAP